MNVYYMILNNVHGKTVFAWIVIEITILWDFFHSDCYCIMRLQKFAVFISDWLRLLDNCHLIGCGVACARKIQNYR